MEKWIRTMHHRPFSIVAVPILGFLWQPTQWPRFSQLIQNRLGRETRPKAIEFGCHMAEMAWSVWYLKAQSLRPNCTGVLWKRKRDALAERRIRCSQESWPFNTIPDESFGWSIRMVNVWQAHQEAAAAEHSAAEKKQCANEGADGVIWKIWCIYRILYIFTLYIQTVDFSVLLLPAVVVVFFVGVVSFSFVVVVVVFVVVVVVVGVVVGVGVGVVVVVVAVAVAAHQQLLKGPWKRPLSRNMGWHCASSTSWCEFCQMSFCRCNGLLLLLHCSWWFEDRTE